MKTEIVKTALSPEQLELIDRVADRLDISRSQFMRQAALEKAMKRIEEMNVEDGQFFKVYADAAYVRDGQVTRVRVGNDFDKDAQPEDFVAVVPSMMTDDEILAIRTP